jgi:polysaccharide biosynthesis protein PslG
VTLPPGTRTLASAVVGALLAGLMSGLASPTAAATATTSAHHGSDTVYRHHSVRVPRSFFGLHDGSMKAYHHLPFGSLRLWDAHVTWRDIETAPGVYDWTRLDALVSAAQTHHVQVTLVLAMTPSFYATSPSQPPSDLDAYARFVRAVMTRYRDFNGRRGITAYQVWNEPNNSYFWTGTPAQMAQLTAVVDRVRDEVDPRATVVAPSFAVRLRYQRLWMDAYQQQHTPDGLPVWRHYDVNALSLYPRPRYGHRSGGPEDAMRLLDIARRQLHRDGVPGSKKIWATEINYGVTGGGLADGSAQPISEQRQVANVLRTYLLGAAHGLSRIFWYRYDWGRVAGGGTLGNTLLTDPDDFARIRGAGRALRIAQRWLQGRLVGTDGHRPCHESRDGTYACTVRHDGVARTIYWNPRHNVRVRVPRAGHRTTVAGRRVTRRATSRMVRVTFRPVIVRTHR